MLFAEVMAYGLCLLELRLSGAAVADHGLAGLEEAAGDGDAHVVRLDRPQPWHLDGEPAPPRDRAELTVEPLAFRMRVTAECPWR